MLEEGAWVHLARLCPRVREREEAEAATISGAASLLRPLSRLLLPAPKGRAPRSNVFQLARVIHPVLGTGCDEPVRSITSKAQPRIYLCTRPGQGQITTWCIAGSYDTYVWKEEILPSAQ